jgi:hypothetical protein
VSLRDFLTIWVVGSILGVTKDVDMPFTRQYNRARLQVSVLDPALISISVDVVIGDSVYELHFKVEPEEMINNPSPLDMEDEGDDRDKMDEGDGGINDQSVLMQDDLDSNPKNKNLSVTSTPDQFDQ